MDSGTSDAPAKDKMCLTCLASIRLPCRIQKTPTLLALRWRLDFELENGTARATHARSYFKHT
jgi:hypothetical protein